MESLLDEPFAGIDPIAVFEIKQIIRALAEKGLLITDRNVRDTLEITTEAFIVNEGAIAARGDRDLSWRMRWSARSIRAANSAYRAPQPHDGALIFSARALKFTFR